MEINKRSLNNKLRLLKNSIIHYNTPLVAKISELGGLSPLIFLKKFKDVPHLLGVLRVIYDLYSYLCKLFNTDLTIKDIYSLYNFNMSNTIKELNSNNIDKSLLNNNLMNSKYLNSYIEFLKMSAKDNTLVDFLNNKY